MKSTSMNRNVIVLLIVFSLIFITYKNTLNNGFVFDDNEQIVGNKWIKDFKYIPEIFSSGVWNFREFYEENGYYYRPLMHLVLLVEYNFFGLVPKNYHLINILMHFINASVLFIFINILFSSVRFLKYEKEIMGGKLAVAFLATVIFGLHPINSEPVNWISAIPELTFTFFYMLSFCFFVIRKNGNNNILSIIFFALALLCKETAVTLPALFMIYEFFIENDELKLNKKIKSILKSVKPFLIILICYLFLRWSILRTDAQLSLSEFDIFIVVNYLFGTIDVFLRNIIEITFPFKLSIFHSYDILQIDKIILLEAIIIVGTYFYIKRLRRGNYNKVILISWLIFAIPLLPALNVVALNNFLLSERYLYLSSMGFSLGFSFIILKFAKKISPNKYKLFLLGTIIFLVGNYFVLFIHKRNAQWKDDFSIFIDAIDKYPNAKIAQFSLAKAYCDVADIEKCKKYYNNFCSILVNKKYINNVDCLNHPSYNIMLGAAYYKNKEFALANEHFKISSNLDLMQAEAYMNMGLTYYQLNETKLAFENLEKALSLKPESRSINKNMGKLYLLEGNEARAKYYFLKAMKFGLEKKEIDEIKEKYINNMNII